MVRTFETREKQLPHQPRGIVGVREVSGATTPVPLAPFPAAPSRPCRRKELAERLGQFFQPCHHSSRHTLTRRMFSSARTTRTAS